MRLISLLWGATLYSCVGAFIVPDQLVSLLTVVYSVIPPIKKGSDSRVGFGYRFGQFADAQVLLELGPQLETQPITGQDPPSNKRHVGKESGDADPGKRPDIQLLDAPAAPAPAKVASSRSARSGPAPVATTFRAAPPPARADPRSDWLSRWRSSVIASAAPSPSTTPVYSSRPRLSRAPAAFGYPVAAAPLRRATSEETRWEAMRRLRSLYWAGQQGR